MNAWIYLAIAIGFEIVGTSLLKASDGFDRIWYGVGSIACFMICFVAMSYAFKTIPVGVAYAVWSGVGIAAIAIIGWFVFKQNMSALQIGFTLMILVGVIGLNLTTHSPTENSVEETA